MQYRCLNKNDFSQGQYSIKPLEYDNRLNIMKWRNEQIYHLRQEKPLTEKDQTTILITLFQTYLNKKNQNSYCLDIIDIKI